MIYKGNDVYTNGSVAFLSMNVRQEDIYMVEKAIRLASDLFSKGLLKEKLLIEDRIILVDQIKRKKLLRFIIQHKKLDIQTEFVFLIHLI